MKDHALLLNLAIYGSFELADGVLLYVNQENRSTWGTGLFQSLRFRLDDTFRDETRRLLLGRALLRRGGQRALPVQHLPLPQGDLTLGGTSYFLDSDTAFRLNNPSFNNAGREPVHPLAGRPMTDALPDRADRAGGLQHHPLPLRHRPAVGQLRAAEATVGVQPFNEETTPTCGWTWSATSPSTDAPTSSFAPAGGTTFGGRYARSYFLSSFDTLRGVNFGDDDWLLGRNFAYSTLELQVPLNDIIRVAFLSDLEAIAGVDVGGVGNSAERLWDRRTLDWVLGFNIAAGAPAHAAALRPAGGHWRGAASRTTAG